LPPWIPSLTVATINYVGTLKALPVPEGVHSKLGFVLTTPFMPLRLLNNTVVEDMHGARG
jgi:hypothetical protein